MLKTEMLKAEMGHGLTRTGTEGGGFGAVVGSILAPDAEVPCEKAVYRLRVVGKKTYWGICNLKHGSCTGVMPVDLCGGADAEGVNDQERKQDEQPSSAAVRAFRVSMRRIGFRVGLLGHGGIEAQGATWGKGGAG